MQHATRERFVVCACIKVVDAPAHEWRSSGEKRWNVAVTSIRHHFEEERMNESGCSNLSIVSIRCWNDPCVERGV